MGCQWQVLEQMLSLKQENAKAGHYVRFAQWGLRVLVILRNWLEVQRSDTSPVNNIRCCPTISLSFGGGQQEGTTLCPPNLQNTLFVASDTHWSWIISNHDLLVLLFLLSNGNFPRYTFLLWSQAAMKCVWSSFQQPLLIWKETFLQDAWNLSALLLEIQKTKDAEELKLFPISSEF